MKSILIKFFVLFPLFYYLPATTKSQSVKISGRVIDNDTKKGLSYANIMVLHCANGTTSDKEGYFELMYDGCFTHDTIVFSYVGYKSKKICINKIGNSPLRIQLLHQTFNLEEVVIRSDLMSKEEKITVVNKFKKRNCFIRYAPVDSISSNHWIPTRPKEPTIEAIYFPYEPEYLNYNRIKEVWLSVSNFSLPATFRLRIIKAGKNVKPNVDLLSIPLIIKSTESKQLIKVNLEQYNLTIDSNGIYIGFELLIIPDNLTSIEVEDETCDLYSPYLNYVKSEDSCQNWIYSKGRWRTNNQKVSTNYKGKNKKKMYYIPAISIVIH